MNAFYTHQQYLTEEIEKLDFTKPITCLEFGTGIGSGDIFSKYTTMYSNFKVISFEHDVDWFTQMKEKYSADNYIFNLVKWEEFDYSELIKEKYDLIFVDQGVWFERARTVKEMINCSDTIIIHDFDYFNKHDSGYVGGCSNIYGTGDDSYWGREYNSIKTLISKADLLPPTLIIKNK